MKRASVQIAVGALLLAFAAFVEAQGSREPETLEADALVQQLRDVPPAIPGRVSSNGVEPPAEVLRDRIYNRLLALSPNSIHVLVRGFHDPDTAFRRNVALALNALSGGWQSSGDGGTHKVDLTPVLPELIAALNDTDSSVRSWVAQGIGNIGAGAASAVPALLSLLASEDEGSRNSACIALSGIGPRAETALPALQRALSDPSPDVQKFAALAIKRIEGQKQ